MASRLTRTRRPPAHHEEQQSRAKWTASLTKILVDLMVDQVHKGQRQKKSFGKKAWKHMCDDFQTKTGLNWDKDQLKNRHAVLRRQYVTVKALLDHSDFSWDEATGTIIASDEAWDDYIKEHPDSESIKSTGCPIYKQLCVIFSEPTTNGKHYQPIECEEKATPLCLPPCPEPLNLVEAESSSDSEEVDNNMADDQDKFQSSSPISNGRKRGRKGIDNAIAGAILEMASASRMRTEAAMERNARYSISNCVRELDEMEDVEESVYFSALDLFDNSKAREIFLSLKGDKRLIWLQGKCAALPSLV